MNQNHIIKRFFYFFIFFSGCYNNSHIRTSKILEEEEKVVSLNGSYNIAPLSYVDYGRIEYNNDSDISDYQPISTEVAGIRGEISLLKGYKSSEAGFYGGIGANFDAGEFNGLIGCEYKKYINHKKLRPLKAGMNIELNKTSGNGTVIHSIQSIKTTTSKNTSNPFYGIHTVLTAGSSSNPDFTSYDFLTKGAGISFGIESSSSIFSIKGKNTSVILQMDASLINNKITDIRKGVVKYWRYKTYPVIAVGLGVNFFDSFSIKADHLTPLPKPRKDPELEFDPETGEPVFDKSRNKNRR